MAAGGVGGFLIDMDGLLLDTERLAQGCWAEAELRSGFRMPEGFYFQLIGQSLPRIEERLMEVMEGGCDVPAFIGTAAALYEEKLSTGGIPVKAGAEAFLAELERRGIPRCLATSTFGEMADRKLRAAGLASYLPLRICGDAVLESKPAPEIYERAAAQLGLGPEACFALEDSENGCLAALAAGCRVLHVPDLAPVSAAVRERVSAVYESLEEVAAALRAGSLG